MLRLIASTRMSARFSSFTSDGVASLVNSDFFRSQCYIDGEWVGADSGETFEVLDPASGELVGRAPAMGAEETDRAISAASKALPAWGALTGKERGAYLLRMFNDITQNADELARIMTLECGKVRHN